MRFWDSSALVPLLVAQASSARVLGLHRNDSDVIAWWGSKVECDSAVARLEREKELTPKSAGEALKRLDALSESWQEIQPVDVLRDSARRLLRTHDLRAADAIQLAAALLACEGRPGTLEIVCLDQRLRLAAEREGFVVLGP